MTINWMDVLAAFGGGLLGAAIGGLPAFIFTGFAVLVGSGMALSGAAVDFTGTVAFGPVLGPHVAFAGGVAAAAFAKKQDKLASGKDITSGLAGLDSPAVLLVGGAFGAFGFLMNNVYASFLAGWTDTVALTVFTVCLVARLMFGNSGVFGTLSPEAVKRGRFTPGGDNVWIPWQKDWLQIAVIGFGFALASAWVTLKVAELDPKLGGAGVVIGFGLSAASLLLLQFGTKVPVTHHITLIAAVAASTSGSLVVGVLFGIISALVAEVMARLFTIHGDTFIDPPASAIWPMTLLVMALGKLGVF